MIVLTENERYIKTCQSLFWQGVFRVETEYLAKHLAGFRDILSVGCGPAIIEQSLVEKGFLVTGLDVSQEALNCAPDAMRTVVAKAEDIPFPESSFDAVIYVASLQFIEDYRKAIEKTTQVLRKRGMLLVMLLNPESNFFKQRFGDPNSYIHKIRNSDLKDIEDFIGRDFTVHTEYFLGIDGNNITEGKDSSDAVLYIIEGKKKLMKKDIG